VLNVLDAAGLGDALGAYHGEYRQFRKATFATA